MIILKIIIFLIIPVSLSKVFNRNVLKCVFSKIFSSVKLVLFPTDNSGDLYNILTIVPARICTETFFFCQVLETFNLRGWGVLCVQNYQITSAFLSRLETQMAKQMLF